MRPIAANATIRSANSMRLLVGPLYNIAGAILHLFSFYSAAIRMTSVMIDITSLFVPPFLVVIRSSLIKSLAV